MTTLRSSLDELGDKLDAFWSSGDRRRRRRRQGPRGVRRTWAGRGRHGLPALRARACSLIPSDSSKHIASSCEGLEVLDRNGGRKPSSLPKLGPLKPAASWFVQLVTRYIVRSYQVSVAENLARLYALARGELPLGQRRDAHAAASALPSRAPRARLQAQGAGLPTFLVGGAVISGAVGALPSVRRHPRPTEAHPRVDDAPAVRPLHPHLVRHPLRGRHLAAPHPRDASLSRSPRSTRRSARAAPRRRTRRARSRSTRSSSPGSLGS